MNALSIFALGAFLLNLIMPGKIKLGISSCLLGNSVRYDGGHKLNYYLRDTLGRFVEWVPVCPEVESGLPVPREAMQLVRDAESRRIITITTRIDHTERMMRWIEEKLVRFREEGLCGFVFKARSPSCGLRDAEIVTPSGAAAGKGAGLFAEAAIARFPALPVEDEERLQDHLIRNNFIEQAFAFQRGQVTF